MKPREKLHYLLRAYLRDEYDTKAFTDQFSHTYFVEGRDEEFTPVERESFEELATIADRFSPYDEDLLIPHVYFSEKQLRDKVREVVELVMPETIVYHIEP